MAHHEPATIKSYVSVFLALLVLTGLTVAVTFVNLGRFNLLIALLIACTKATLVVFFFMHVNNSSPLTRLFVVAGLFWMSILIVLTFTDYLSRDWLPNPQGWQDPQKRAAPVQTDQH